MVVEDEALLLKAVTKKLDLAGFEVISCTSGIEAMDYLENKGTAPDLIWLDYYLPDTNGLELAQRLKGDKRWKDIPVILVTNSAGLDKVNRMRELGIETYFVKSDHRLEEIVGEVKKIVGRSG